MQTSEIMSRHPLTVTPQKTLREAAQIMDRNKQLVGIASLGNIPVRGGGGHVGATLEPFSQPGGAHSRHPTRREAIPCGRA